MKKVILVFMCVCVITLSVLLGTFLQQSIALEKTKPPVEDAGEVLETIAIVNMDDGIQKGDQIIHYASDVVQAQDEYVITGLMDAREGVENNLYAAYIIVPENFSIAVDSINKTPEIAQLVYVIHPNLTTSAKDSAIQKVQVFEKDLDYKIGYMYLTSILSEFHAGQEEVEQVLKNDEKNIEVINAVSAIDLTVSIELEGIEEKENNTPASINLEEEQIRNEEAITTLQNILTSSQEDVNTHYKRVVDGVNEYQEEVRNYVDKVKGLDVFYDEHGQLAYDYDAITNATFLDITPYDPNRFTQYMERVIKATIEETEKKIEEKWVKENTATAQEITIIGRKRVTQVGEGLPADHSSAVAIYAIPGNDTQGYTGFLDGTIIDVEASGQFAFTLHFVKEGTYRFYAKEVIGTEKGHAYDNEPVMITITVIKGENNELQPVAVISKDHRLLFSSDVWFEGTYQELDDTTSKESESTNNEEGGASNIPVTVTISANRMIIAPMQAVAPTISEGQFTYTIEADESNDVNGYSGLVASASTDDKGNIHLGTLTFTKPGTYTFYILENGGNEEGHTYDMNRMQITVVVSAEVETGTLVTDIRYNTTTPTFYGVYLDVLRLPIVTRPTLNMLDAEERTNLATGILESEVVKTGSLSDDLFNEIIVLMENSILEKIQSNQANRIENLPGISTESIDQAVQDFDTDKVSLAQTQGLHSFQQIIENVFSDMIAKVNDQDAGYMLYIQEMEVQVIEYTTTLLHTVLDNKTKSDEQIEVGLTKAREIIATSSQINIDLLQSFISRLSYSKQGGYQNKEVKDHILSPTDSLTKEELEAQPPTATTVSNVTFIEEYGVLLMNGTLGLVLISAIGYVIYTKKVKA